MGQPKLFNEPDSEALGLNLRDGQGIQAGYLASIVATLSLVMMALVGGDGDQRFMPATHLISGRGDQPGILRLPRELRWRAESNDDPVALVEGWGSAFQALPWKAWRVFMTRTRRCAVSNRRSA